MYTQGEETAAMRDASYKVMNNYYANKSSSTSNGNSGFNYWVSGIKATGGSIADNIGSKVGKLINTGYRKICDIKAFGPAFRVNVAGKSFSKSLGKKALGYVGDIGIGAYSALDSFKKGEVVGGLIDLGSAALGAYAGTLITASTPIWVTAAIGVGTFVVVTAVTIYIDKSATEIKDNYYGR